jgi:hypothetical protein
MEAAFAEIRDNEAQLQYFFTQMPKGGDLHNHLTGSAYAETYFKIALDKQMWLDRETHTLRKADDGKGTLILLKEGMQDFHAIYMECIDHWSARNFEYVQRGVAPDEFFFGSFGVFGTASDGSDLKEYQTTLLEELRARAEAENVLYLEIMLTGPRLSALSLNDAALNERLKSAIADKDEAAFEELLAEIYQAWEGDSVVQRDAVYYAQFVADVHEAASHTAPGVVSRYQGYANSHSEPLRVFAQLYLSFKACQTSDLLVGVNILQAENGENSLRDYWGHMGMFAFLKERIPVKASLHAGELRLGLVAPEELKFHISDAVRRAQADRIGHGVDIAFESSAKETLEYMAANNRAVEINLTSNEFILGVKGGEHPLLLYLASKVPIVLSTDDAGVLRTNLTEQYVLATLRYPELSYGDFKRFSYNSLEYSFLPGDEKAALTAELANRFAEFENEYIGGK